MKNRGILLLTVLMILSLGGIIVIQYRWISNAVAEKQKLIDSQVYHVIDDLEQALTDHRAMTFIGDSTHHHMSIQSEIIADDFNFTQILHEGVQLHDNDLAMEIQVVSSDSGFAQTNHQQHIIKRNIVTDKDSITLIHLEEGLGQIESVMQRMKIEFFSDLDSRLDSTNIDRILNEFLIAAGLEKSKSWGIWDSHKERYFIQPSLNQKSNYNIPLFTSDIRHPGRYNLHLTLHNNQLIWSEIWPMIILSALFVLVILAAFLASVRLTLRHKKISAIKSDFINNMTHEFKTPLASISLAADSLIHPGMNPDQDSLKKYVGIIQSEKNKLNLQVERILEVAALQKGVITIETSPASVKSTLDKALGHFSLLIEQNQLSLTVEDFEDFNACFNEFHLENVLINIIDNGIKYSKELPEIKIQVNEQNQTITISDKGIGMTQQQLRHVFDDFYRAETGNIHNTKGFGLGLSYSKRVMMLMKGDLFLTSEYGKGTQAQIKLLVL